MQHQSAGTARAAWKSAGMRTSQLPTVRGDDETWVRTRGRGGSRGGVGSLGPHGVTDVLDRYRLHRRLGAGAFGTVWAARDERLDRDVALKIVPRERIVPGRFEREARAAARLSHPGIVTLYEAAVDDHDAYLVSELVHGATLDQLLDEGRLSDHDIVAIAISLCDALAHAHSQGVVHRDVKPSNILIPERPPSDTHRAKLTDFGVARLIGGDALTNTGEVVGTAAYMAPEQAEGRDAGAAADLYSLALVTYEALTGVNPVRTGTAAVRARRLGAHLPPLRRQRRDLPPELGRAIDLALRPRARERGRLEELAAQLTTSVQALDDTPGIVEPGWTFRTRREERGLDADAEPLQAGDLEAGEHPTRPQRALAAGCAAIFTAWLTSHFLTPSATPPAATIAGLLVLAAPRLGWAATSAGLALAAAASHRPGVGLLILIAVPVPAVLLPRRGTDWPVAALSPALGLIGLAGAWPALAARLKPSAARRAALGAVGWIWLSLAAPLAGEDLYTRVAPGTTAPHTWTASLNQALHGMLIPLARSGTLSAAPVWAIAALVLPWLVRSRSLAINAVLTTIWCAMTVAATQAAIGLSHPPHGSTTMPTAVTGAIAAGLIALTPGILNAWRQRPQSRGSPAELA